MRSLTLALALSNCSWEADLVAALTARGGAARQLGWKISVRRCLGLAELLADVGRGAATAAVIDANFPQLTAGMLAHIQAQIPGVVALCVDEDAERHARQLGFDQVVPVEVDDPARTVSLILAAQPSRELHGGHAADNAPPVSEGPVPPRPVAGLAAAPAQDGQASVAATVPALGRLIAFWGPPGAPGRTTLALAVAHTVARRGIETIVIDGDSRAPGVAAALGVLDADSGLPTVANLADRGALNVYSLARHARQLDGNWRVLTGLQTAEDWRLLPAAAVSQVLRCARALCEFVVVDVGPELERDDELTHDQLLPRRDATALVACESADVVVAVCGPEPAALARLCSRLPEVRALAPTADFVVVVNRARTRLGPVASEPEIRRVLGDAFDAHVEFVPDDQRSFDIATCRQELPTERFPRSPFAAAVGRLADHLTSSSLAKVSG